MANYSTSEFKSGLKVMLDGDPCAIIENEFVKPGKGQAFNRVKLRNLKSGKVWERTFKSGDSLEGADVMDVSMQYLYADGEFWHFMDQTTFEQKAADEAAVGDAKLWLKEEDVCEITLYNGEPLSVSPPQFRGTGNRGNRPGPEGRHRGHWRQACHPDHRCSGPCSAVCSDRRNRQGRHPYR